MNGPSPWTNSKITHTRSTRLLYRNVKINIKCLPKMSWNGSRERVMVWNGIHHQEILFCICIHRCWVCLMESAINSVHYGFRQKKSDSSWFKTECILSKKWCNCVFTQMRYENEHHFMLGCFNNRPYHSDGEARLNGTLKLIKFGKRCVRYSLENMHKEHEHMSVIVLTHNILWAWILIRHSNETPMDRNQFHHFVISATKSIGN